jgi:hypothetical protein
MNALTCNEPQKNSNDPLPERAIEEEVEVEVVKPVEINYDVGAPLNIG